MPRKPRTAPPKPAPEVVAPPEPADIPAPEVVEPEVVADDDTPEIAPEPEPEPAPAPEPVGPFVFTERFMDSPRGLNVDKWRQRCLAEVREAGHTPVRQTETQSPPLGKPTEDGMRTWELTIFVEG